MSGEPCAEFLVPTDASVMDVKVIVEAQTQIPPCRQKLLLEQVELFSAMTMPVAEVGRTMELTLVVLSEALWVPEVFKFGDVKRGLTKIKGGHISCRIPRSPSDMSIGLSAKSYSEGIHRVTFQRARDPTAGDFPDEIRRQFVLGVCEADACSDVPSFYEWRCSAAWYDVSWYDDGSWLNEGKLQMRRPGKKQQEQTLREHRFDHFAAMLPTRVGAVFEMTLDCSNHCVSFRAANGLGKKCEMVDLGVVKDLPDQPLHYFVQLRGSGSAWRLVDSLRLHS